ncbi:hypothetical protein EJB05_32098 [Eragrostis curvula]|uniref:CCHC-type domain-containing protein n=1 Tax=Eragrostis curvula TaxID=38414 RepID=A0A5J9UG43_9POAL|nr:hypothetical protein EJB05_32098 [Eragrostis curvula]
MAREPSPEIDDELFNEVYGKAYSGPVAPVTNSVMPEVNDEKKPQTSDKSDEEEEPPDPNAVPTDFTSREAKVWEAKAKATERNWKKRKEEEMICKICGDAGHFTQGCPSTLGANRRNVDFFERVPAREKQVRDLFTERTISQIEKDVGCKIRMDEKFLFVSGKDRLILAKGVDAVHKVIQEGKGKLSPSSPKRDRSRSPSRNTNEFRPRPSDSQRPRSPRTSYSQRSRSPRNSHSHRSRSPRNSYSQQSRSPRNSHSQRSRSPRNASHSQSKGYYDERHLDGRLHDNMSKFSKGSPQARGKFKIYVLGCEVFLPDYSSGRLSRIHVNVKCFMIREIHDSTHYMLKDLFQTSMSIELDGMQFARSSANFGAKGHPAQSKSPRHPSYLDDSLRTRGVNNQYAVTHMPSNWCIERHGSESRSGPKFDMPSHQQTLEELEMEFKREATELVRARVQEEDEENRRHQEYEEDITSFTSLSIKRGSESDERKPHGESDYHEEFACKEGDCEESV